MDILASSANNSNVTPVVEGSCEHYATDTSWVPPYMYTISALGIVLNLLVLLVFLLHKKNCTASEIYLSNMATSDLLLVVFMPFWGVYVAKGYSWTFGGPMCKIVSLLIVLNYNTSIYFLVLVCVDRYMALVHPLSQWKLRRRKYAKLYCFLVWCFCLLLNIPSLMCRQTVSHYLPYNETFWYNTGEYTCRWVCTKNVFLANELIQTFAAFVTPLLIILFCTVKIIQALRGRPTQIESTLHNEHKATILVLVVLLSFFICWSPFSLTRMIELAVRYDIIPATCTISRHLAVCRHLFLNFGFFNSDLNPVLYVLVGKNFRKKMWDVVGSSGLRSMSSTIYTTTSSVLFSNRNKVNANAVI